MRQQLIQERLTNLEHRTDSIELKVHNSDQALGLLTDRVDAIAQSLARLETSIQSFLHAWESFLRFLKGFLKWGVGITTAVMTTLLATYLLHLFFH